MTKKSFFKNSEGRKSIDREKSSRIIESHIQKRGTIALRLS
jgi:hypothetical protein